MTRKQALRLRLALAALRRAELAAYRNGGK